MTDFSSYSSEREIETPRRRRRSRRRAAATMLVTFGLALLVSVGLTASAGAAAAERITICHATGSASNPYVRITVSVNSVQHKGHLAHSGDIIPAPPEGCPKGDDSDDITYDEICRNGAVIEIPEGTRIDGDTDAPCVDACPDDLNPGIQPVGTTCKVAEPDPVDACPDALNPGIQTAGTVCIVAVNTDTGGSNDTPGASDTNQDVSDTGDNEQESTFGDFNGGGPDASDAVEGDDATAVAGANIAAGGTSAVSAPSGSLPLTGLTVTQIALLGAGLVLVGLGLAVGFGGAPRVQPTAA
jgi:hypothetical protein